MAFTLDFHPALGFCITPKRFTYSCIDKNQLGGAGMDFTLPPEIEDLRKRTRAFVETHVLPLESDHENFSEHENIPLARLAPVQEQAKRAGLWAPQSPKEFGGMALPIV
ncbi:MAG: acyl-CoA dehydrogenase family protein, partial [Xanthobacteraceae bacterium]